MKLFARLHTIILLGFFLTLAFLWLLSSPLSTYGFTRSRPSTHIVAFGDSWSNSGRIDFRGNRSRTATDMVFTRDKLWVEVLCYQLVCDSLINLAQPFPISREQQRGPVVDDDIFGNAVSSLNLTLIPGSIPDLKVQVDQYFAQREQIGGPETYAGQTIFTAFFGIWDIWTFVQLPEAEAHEAVTKSVESLFAQVDRLVRSYSLRSSEKPLVIIPKVPDPTWFPRWFAERTRSSDKFGKLERQAVQLTEQWNDLLVAQADQRQSHAMTLLPDFDQWILDQFRAPERVANGFANMFASSSRSVFTELRQPCVNYTASFPNSMPICSDPTRHLFWDDVRLSSAAHAELGRNVYQMIQKAIQSATR